MLKSTRQSNLYCRITCQITDSKDLLKASRCCQFSLFTAFINSFCLPIFFLLPLPNFPIPSSMTLSSVFPSFLSFPYYGQSIISSLLPLHCLMKQQRVLIHSCSYFFTANQSCSSLASSLGDSYLHCIFLFFVWINYLLKKNNYMSDQEQKYIQVSSLHSSAHQLTIRSTGQFASGCTGQHTSKSTGQLSNTVKMSAHCRVSRSAQKQVYRSVH